MLHVDGNNYYGGPEAAFSLQEAEAWAESLTGKIRRRRLLQARFTNDDFSYSFLAILKGVMAEARNERVEYEEAVPFTGVHSYALAAYYLCEIQARLAAGIFTSLPTTGVPGCGELVVI